VPEFTTIPGYRVVASPSTIDALVAQTPAPTMFRFAPDDLFVIGPIPNEGPWTVSDPHAIVEEEHGFSRAWFEMDEFDHCVRPHIDWVLPDEPRVLAQGLVANVPAKVLFADAQAMVMTNTVYVDELAARLHE
jgi:hypothetical protein